MPLFQPGTGKFAKGRMKNMERINRDVGDIDDVRVGWLVFLEAWEEVATLEVNFS